MKSESSCFVEEIFLKCLMCVKALVVEKELIIGKKCRIYFKDFAKQIFGTLSRMKRNQKCF